MTWSTDALWLGPAIAERLRQHLPGLRSAQVMDDLSPENSPAQLPAAVVLLQSLAPTADADGRVPVALVQMDWVVAVVVGSYRQTADAQRSAAGPLLAQAVHALHGWTPTGCRQPLAWVPGGPRPYFTRTFAAYPLLLRALATTRSDGGLPPLT